MADVEVVEEAGAPVEDSTVPAIPADSTPPVEDAVEAPVPDAPVTQPEPRVRKPRTPRTEARLTHVVLRRFHGAGAERFPGEVVDASGWFAERLVDARRLRALTPDDPAPIEAAGRHFIDDDSLIAYAASVVDEVDVESEED
jgi:hypothetical protein